MKYAIDHVIVYFPALHPGPAWPLSTLTGPTARTGRISPVGRAPGGQVTVSTSATPGGMPGETPILFIESANPPASTTSPLT